MSQVLYQSERALVAEIAGVVHYIATMPGKHARPFHSVVSVNGSCCMMDGPMSLPDSVEAMTAVTMWALKQEKTK
jgi:hypothetical protein